MAEKKTAAKKATKKVVEAEVSEVEVKKCAKKPCAKKPCAKKAEAPVEEPAKAKVSKAKKAVEDSAYINSQSVGFRAGDVYQTLAAAGKTLTVAEIAKAANLTNEQVLLGLGWLFKEGKVKGENVADLSLA